MAIDKIWVLAEYGDAGPTSVDPRALDRGAPARLDGRGGRLGHRHRGRWPRPSGEYGATTVYDVGDLGGGAARRAGGGRHRRAGRGRQRPRHPARPGQLRRPRRRRPPVGQARPAGAHQRDRARGRRRRCRTQHPLFGGTLIVTARFTGEGPGIFVIRAKSFAAEPSGGGPAAVVAAPAPDTGATNGARDRGAPRRGAHRSEARRGERRRLGRPRPRARPRTTR